MALRVTSAYYPASAGAGAASPPTRAVSDDQLSFQQRRQLVASSLSFSDLLSGHKLRVAAAAAAKRGDTGMSPADGQGSGQDGPDEMRGLGRLSPLHIL